MKIAKEKGLQELKHHILPRTKGFTLLLQGAEDRSKKKNGDFSKLYSLMKREGLFCIW